MSLLPAANCPLLTGNCPLPTILLLAPIRGVTDVVYRNAFATCFGGLDGALAPFLQLRQGHPLRPAELQQVAVENNNALRTIPQVLTNHPQTFSAAIRELGAAGHEEVNWNLGCPYPTVVGRGRGAGLLPDAKRIEAILNEVMNEASVRLSVKLRLGYHDPDEFEAILEVLNRYPLADVILHARTADQMYDGEVDLARAGRALALCRHPFIYNGDITSVEGLLELGRKLPGTKAWMIGRGALRNPFLPIQMKGAPLPSSDVRREKLIKFHGLLFEGYSQWVSGPQHRFDKMLEQWEYLSQVFLDPKGIYSRIRGSNPASYLAAVEWSFRQSLSC
ncbi:MAG: tRNA-dihydrouridine synthase family protein [bacterium]